MGFVKKILALSAMCFGLASSFSSFYAAERVQPNEAIMQYGFNAGSTLRATTSGDLNFVPTIYLSQDNRNSGTYLNISVNDPDLHITVDGPSGSQTSTLNREDQYHYSYRATQRGWYEVTAWGVNGVKRSESIYISDAYNDTDIYLSKEFVGNLCYLIIEADTNHGINRVTVNGSQISFSSSGDTVSYRVYNSGTYTVEVTDNYGNRESKSIYINIYDDDDDYRYDYRYGYSYGNSYSDVVYLSLSKNYKNGSWYLTIKADADEGISRVTVDGSSISFPTNGGTEDYKVTKSGTYKVNVTDKNGRTRTQSLYIDVNENDNVRPTVRVSQNYKTGTNPGWYLIIKAQDNDGIASVTVNGLSVPYDTSKQWALYYVPVDGTYTIVVTDGQGNQTTTSTFAAGNVASSMNNNTYVNNNTSNYTNNNSGYSTGSATSVFKLGSPYWTQNGMTMERMSVAPRSIRSRVYLPIRYIAYALGIQSGNIIWDSGTSTVTIHDGSDTIELRIGSRTMYVNGYARTMDVAPAVISGRVLLPISQIYTAFSNRHIQMNWDNYAKQLTVRS